MPRLRTSISSSPADSWEPGPSVFPDTGVDLLAGGPADDRLRARDEVRGKDALNGGAGDDACSADPGDAVSDCRH
jgi:hypothetical protein